MSIPAVGTRTAMTAAALKKEDDLEVEITELLLKSMSLAHVRELVTACVMNEGDARHTAAIRVRCLLIS